MSDTQEYARDGVVSGRSQNVVRLGVHEYTLVPQPQAIILRKFPQVAANAQNLQGEEINSAEDFIALVAGREYDVLKILIPNLMPQHEFEGFATKQAQEAGEFDEDFARDHAPTVPEVMHAFDVGFKINGGERLKTVLGNVVGPEISRAIRQFAVSQMKLRLSRMQLNSPLNEVGLEDSTSSGQSSPTPEIIGEPAEEKSSEELVSVGSPSQDS